MGMKISTANTASTTVAVSAGHRVIEDQRRVHVDIRLHHRIGVQDIPPEDDPRHFDAVARLFRRRHRAHERLGGKRQMRQNHVEMALADRLIRRFDHRSARVMQPRRGVGELHEVFEVVQRRITPSPLKVRREGGAVSRHQNDVVAAEGDGHFRIARDKIESCGRRRAQRSRQSRREAHPLPFNLRASVGEKPAGDRIAPELNADFGQDPVRLIFDALKRRRAQKVIGGDIALSADRRRDE